MGARSRQPQRHAADDRHQFLVRSAGGHQAGTALIDNGCDLLFGIMDEAGYLQVAEQRGVWAAMWNTDIRRFGPKAYVSSIVHRLQEFYVDQVRQRLEGTWTAAADAPADGRRRRPRRLGRDGSGRTCRSRPTPCATRSSAAGARSSARSRTPRATSRSPPARRMTDGRSTTGIGRSRA